MARSPRHPSFPKASAFVAMLAFLWALTLAYAAPLHAHAHSDAVNPSHVCAAVLVQTGGMENCPAVLPAFSSPARGSESKVVSCAAAVVASVFLNASVFEHAPPSVVA